MPRGTDNRAEQREQARVLGEQLRRRRDASRRKPRLDHLGYADPLDALARQHIGSVESWRWALEHLADAGLLPLAPQYVLEQRPELLSLMPPSYRERVRWAA